jgi:hypothetical protein
MDSDEKEPREKKGMRCVREEKKKESQPEKKNYERQQHRTTTTTTTTLAVWVLLIIPMCFLVYFKESNASQGLQPQRRSGG